MVHLIYVVLVAVNNTLCCMSTCYFYIEFRLRLALPTEVPGGDSTSDYHVLTRHYERSHPKHGEQKVPVYILKYTQRNNIAYSIWTDPSVGHHRVKKLCSFEGNKEMDYTPVCRACQTFSSCPLTKSQTLVWFWPTQNDRIVYIKAVFFYWGSIIKR